MNETCGKARLAFCMPFGCRDTKVCFLVFLAVEVVFKQVRISSYFASR